MDCDWLRGPDWKRVPVGTECVKDSRQQNPSPRSGGKTRRGGVKEREQIKRERETEPVELRQPPSLDNGA